ncbi:MAG: AMP-binding protein, partial [Bifidobacteriaceae bacterium]|nr:AMP-binding protein [Bifidobacteriaceae bacterium]
MNILEKLQNLGISSPDQVLATEFSPNGKKKITYSEFDEITDAFAEILINKYKIKESYIIPITCTSDLPSIIALFTILKTRAKLGPINPRCPEEQKKNFMSFIEFPFVFDDELFESLSEKYRAGFVKIKKKKGFRKLNKDFSDIDENEFKIVMLTSGSTNLPKGVMIPLRSVTVGFDVDADANIFRFGNPHFLLPHISFIAGLNSAIIMIREGGPLILVSNEYKADFKKCLEIANEAKAFSMFCPPQAVKIADALAPNVKYLLVGGDVVRKAGAKNIHVREGFGITEAGGMLLYKNVQSDDDMSGLLQGPDSKVYILDEDLKKVKSGEKGEICVAGPKVSFGYYKNPDLTNEKYVKNPYSDEKKFQRLYRTGDIGYYNEKHEIMYVGRKDWMVNIRGFKVELQGIENKVMQLFPIEKICVLDYQKGLEKKLFLIFSSNQKIDINQMKQKLEDHLPDYMIPQVIMQIETLPLNRNNKIDRKEIRRLYVDNLSTSRPKYAAPESAEEKEICDVFSKTLNVEKFGLDDSFAKLGGSSILATQAAAAMKSVKLNPLDILKFETPRLLVKSATEKNYIPKYESRECYPLTFSEKQIYAEYSISPDYNAYHVGTAFELSGKNVSHNSIENALIKMIKEVAALRSGYKIIDKEIVRYIKDVPDFTLDVETIKDISELEREAEKLEYTYDLNSDYLFRFKLLELGNRKILLLHFHHIIVDGTAITAFIDEFINVLSGGQIAESVNNFNDWSILLDKKKDELTNGDYFREIVSSAKNSSKIAPTLHGSFNKNAKRKGKPHIETIKIYKKKLEKIANEHGCSLYHVFISLIGFVTNIYYSTQTNVLG